MDTDNIQTEAVREQITDKSPWLMEAVKLRVALGVTVIESRFGYALTEIDLDDFDITQDTACVLGQLTGSYRAACDGWGLSQSDREAAGFTCSTLEYDDDETTALQIEWHRVIAEAQGRDIPTHVWPYGTAY